MADRMRLLELCLRECAATFGWNLTGNFLACSKGYLSFILLPSLSERAIEYTLSYRYSSFDRVYHAITMANVYPGYTIVESSQHVESWSLMGVSTAMRTLTSKADRFAQALSDRIINVDDNIGFLNFIQRRDIASGLRPRSITTEIILTYLLTGDNENAVAAAEEAIRAGDNGGGLYQSVIDYARRMA
ncbi:MAG: hypothetical protein IJL69_03890 [Oscillospiraceae bacterium]|nr:hypothetical protein [Oscillospiraceae bacterium]